MQAHTFAGSPTNLLLTSTGNTSSPACIVQALITGSEGLGFRGLRGA